MHENAICWIDGRILPAAEACISVFDHGLLYGDGVFEGIRFYARRAFRLHEHLQRLNLSARAIGLALPYDLPTLATAVQETIVAFGENDGYLRLVVTRGAGPLGLDPRGCTRPTTFIIADRLELVSETARRKGARLVIAATRRLPADGLDPRIKSLNYLNHILARMEASHAGADEAILLNAAGRVAEGTADNVFVVRDNRLLTPPVTEGALEGVTRAVVIELAEAAGIAFEERPLAPYDLYTADECFLTGSGAELIPVAEVDGRAVAQCPGPVFEEIARRFRKLVLEEGQ
ncbi:MAG: branched-chain-amino-acid transaminase [Chromatiales bacterium]|jgi:branched-chain amino acid aminotransferase|nr:branched-chain-amino-acid transaminase [Chromatiales bacterium]MDX9766989.1 branched-chain-amino-acid transaminase [Ectothiorhodospiraceae bacterium]